MHFAPRIFHNSIREESKGVGEAGLVNKYPRKILWQELKKKMIFMPKGSLENRENKIEQNGMERKSLLKSNDE